MAVEWIRFGTHQGNSIARLDRLGYPGDARHELRRLNDKREIHAPIRQQRRICYSCAKFAAKKEVTDSK